MFGHKIGALRRVLGLLLAFALALNVAAAAPARAEGSGMIRVKLTRLGTPASITLALDCAYVLDGDARMNLPAGSQAVVRAENGALTVECSGVKLYCGSGLRLLRCGGAGLRFVSPALANRFCGDLTLSLSGGYISTVLRIGLEDYLYGVVGYEMSNSYPLEALKAQAVAARNYALKKMNARASRDYDVTDNTYDQVFKGFNAGQTRVIQAVDETRGQVLYASSGLASCYYGASNGGQTESAKNAWGSSLSYSTVRDDPYDLANASAKQTVATLRRDCSDLNDSLRAALLEGAASVLSARRLDAASAEIVAIRSIEPVNPKYASPSRLYRNLRFGLILSARSQETGAQTQVPLTVDVPTYGAFEDWYGLSINSAINETVYVESDAKAFQVIFRRWGHGIGMSQRGAQYMAASCGMSCAQILDYYYPTTSLRTLSLAVEGAHAALNEAAGAATARLRADSPLRSHAGEDATASALLRGGLDVQVLDVQGDWAKVQIHGLEGWLPLEVLDGDLSAIEPLPTESPEPTESASPSPKATIAPTATIAPSATAIPTAPPAPTFAPQPTAVDDPMPTTAPAPAGAEGMLVATGELYAYVNVASDSSLTLRKAPTTASASLGYLRRGAKVQMLAFDDEWACVSTEAGVQGFVARQYLYLPGNSAGDQPVANDEPKEESSKGFREVKTSIVFCRRAAIVRTDARLYQSYSTASAVLATLPASAKVTVAAYNQKWAYVSCESGKGFVLLKYLKAA